MSKQTIRTILLLALLVMGSTILVRAQGVSPYFGLGTALDSAGTSVNQPSTDPVTGAAITVTCTTKGELYDDFTGRIVSPALRWEEFLACLERISCSSRTLASTANTPSASRRPSTYQTRGLKYRPGFYDFNVVWEPTSGADKRIVPVIEGGIGGARIALYVAQSVSVTGITSNFSYSAGINANHFQIHGAVGAKLYVKGNIFIKPQFDIRYVTHLTDQFGRDWVPEITAAVGYTFGQR